MDTEQTGIDASALDTTIAMDRCQDGACQIAEGLKAVKLEENKEGAIGGDSCTQDTIRSPTQLSDSFSQLRLGEELSPEAGACGPQTSAQQPPQLKQGYLQSLKEDSRGVGPTVPEGVGHKKLFSWLNKNMKIEMTDGRVLIGVFLCTDRDANVILGSCSEYINPEVCGFTDEPRILGLVMVPGRHIVSIHHDAGPPHTADTSLNGLYYT